MTCYVTLTFTRGRIIQVLNATAGLKNWRWNAIRLDGPLAGGNVYGEATLRCQRCPGVNDQLVNISTQGYLEFFAPSLRLSPLGEKHCDMVITNIYVLLFE